ncbi:transmembrane protein, putative (macronuclear) [Tetrahymena thermophila SB210]|uniref:Transmembrane protein, putative n=1 Tax=Tetrahymena thermophila (strain SB210) TaxID=312017 RepID=W7XAD5_TETTS|nr:transmembrane protein, putative [Tetrahymena thermophila SB210]EWS76350.1 transmembrane protein, putative [Tetrahymena thermophila SB210]|eukprot:XP_012651134.1 transmembrane protein, putative [Tetrahymena thermophila SB210]
MPIFDSNFIQRILRLYVLCESKFKILVFQSRWRNIQSQVSITFMLCDRQDYVYRDRNNLLVSLSLPLLLFLQIFSKSMKIHRLSNQYNWQFYIKNPKKLWIWLINFLLSQPHNFIILNLASANLKQI